MKYLITGGCGFLGSNLGAYILEHKMGDLIVFDNLSTLGSEQNKKWLESIGSFNFVHGDIRSFHDIKEIVGSFRPDIIFHLAGQVAMTTSLENPRKDFEINLLGSFNVLEAVRLHSRQSKILYSSTNKVYGDLESFKYKELSTRYELVEHPKGLDELVGLDFRSPYGCSKGAADQFMLDFHRMYGVQTVVFRHSSMYGNRQYATYGQGWIGWFCRQAQLQKRDPGAAPFTISGNGKQVRDLLFIDDLIRLYFAATKAEPSCYGEAYNIGGGFENSLSLLELFSQLESMLGVQLKYFKNEARISDQKVFIANISKAQRAFGWQPQVTYRIGLEKMLEWTAHEF